MACASCQSLIKEGSPGEAMLIILIVSPVLSMAKTGIGYECSVMGLPCMRKDNSDFSLTIILDLLALLGFVLHYKFVIGKGFKLLVTILSINGTGDC